MGSPMRTTVHKTGTAAHSNWSGQIEGAGMEISRLKENSSRIAELNKKVGKRWQNISSNSAIKAIIN